MYYLGSLPSEAIRFKSAWLWLTLSEYSFAATGAVAVIIGWFILPEVALRTPAEIDEM